MGEYADDLIFNGIMDMAEDGCFPRRHKYTSHVEYFWFEVDYIVKETQKAIRVKLKGGAEHWIPKSVYIGLDKELPKDIGVPEWFIKKVEEAWAEKYQKQEKQLTEIWDEEDGDNAWCLPEDMGSK
jgi:hypothetical protein